MGFMDTMSNFLAGLGDPFRDKSAVTTYMFTPMVRAQLEAAYRTDWIARKAIEIPARDATRMWRAWQAEDDQIEKLEELEKKFCVQQKLQDAIIKSRLYGGSVAVIGVEDGLDTAVPLDLERIKEGSLKFIHVVSKDDIKPDVVNTDVSSEWYGEPNFYETVSRVGSEVPKKIHPSRVVRLVGLPTPDPIRDASNGPWGDPVLQIINDSVMNAGTVINSIATMVFESKVDVLKIPKLSSVMGTKESSNRLVQRMNDANAYKSIVNMLVIDKEEEWERIATNYGGIPDLLNAYLMIVCGAADIPATRFLGRSPQGMNATGESDLRNLQSGSIPDNL